MLAQDAAGAVQRIKPEPDFQVPLFARVFQVLFGLFRLFLQRPDARFQLREDVVQAQQVFLRLIQPALRLLFPVPEPRDPGGLLEDFAPVLAAGGDDAVDPALSDHGVAVAPEAGIHEELVDVAEPDGVFIDEVLAFAGTVIPPRDGDRIAVERELAAGVVECDRHFGVALRLARRGSAEHDILHFGAAQHSGRLFAEHPAHRVADVAFPAAVRAHDRRDAGAEAEGGFVRKGLEALKLQRLEQHRFHLPSDLVTAKEKGATVSSAVISAR